MTMIYNKKGLSALSRQIMIFGAGASIIAAVATGCGPKGPNPEDQKSAANSIFDAANKRQTAIQKLGYPTNFPALADAVKLAVDESGGDLVVAVLNSLQCFNPSHTGDGSVKFNFNCPGVIGEFIKANLASIPKDADPKTADTVKNIAIAYGLIAFVEKHNALVDAIIGNKGAEAIDAAFKAVLAVVPKTVEANKDGNGLALGSGTVDFTEKPDAKYKAAVEAILKDINDANAIIGSKDALEKVVKCEAKKEDAKAGDKKDESKKEADKADKDKATAKK